MTVTKYDTLVKNINREYRIRLRDKFGRNSLVGAGMLYKHIGLELATKLMQKAEQADDVKSVHALRRGLIVEFVAR